MTRTELIKEAKDRAQKIREARERALAVQGATLLRYADNVESFTEFTDRIARVWGKQ